MRLLSSVLLFLSVSYVSAAEVAILPSADTYVFKLEPDRNYGNDNELGTKNGSSARYAYLPF